MSDKAKNQFIQLPQLRLAIKVWGPETGMPIFAFHGWLDNASSFDALAEKLPKLRLIAVDLPGHGLSQHRHDGVYHFIDYVADAISIANGLQFPRFCLLGHSLGAGIAALAAGTIPERVAGVVLIEGVGPLTNQEQDAPQVLRYAVEQNNQSEQQSPRLYQSIAEALAVRVKVNNLSAELLQPIVERGLEQVEAGWQWRADPKLRLGSRLRLTEAQVYAFLEKITCPLLCVVAKEGFVHLNAQAFQNRTRCIQDISIVELAGGHHVHIEHAEAVARTIEDFLAKQKILT